jgi:hypothetical protein
MCLPAVSYFSLASLFLFTGEVGVGLFGLFL